MITLAPGVRRICPGLGDAQWSRGMSVTLNNEAYDFEKKLADGRVVRDERDDWSEAAPTA